MGGRYCEINSPFGPQWGQKSLDLWSQDFAPTLNLVVSELRNTDRPCRFAIETPPNPWQHLVIFTLKIFILPDLTESNVHPSENEMALFFRTNYLSLFFCNLFYFSYMTYMRWSIWIMLFFVGFRSLVTFQWHFEKGNYVKPNVTLFWPMQCTSMALRHGLACYLHVARMLRVGMKCKLW